HHGLGDRMFHHLGMVDMKQFFRTCQAAVMLAILASAQVERARITGTVTDNTGAVLPGVQVKITNEGTNTSTSIVTDAAGAYSLPNLAPGSYTVEAEKAGFARHVNKGFVLQVAQEARLDIQLGVGSVEQTIEVRGTTPLLQTEGSSVGQVIDSQ